MENYQNSTLGTTHSFSVALDQEPMRADVFISKQLPTHSRTFVQTAIQEKRVKINDKLAKPSSIVKPLDQIVIELPELPQISYQSNPEIEAQLATHQVTIVFEHPEFLIIEKPAGLMVHKPSPFNLEVTLVDWLLSKWHTVASVGHQDRPGIVHRLDKDTSGLMIIPRTNYCHMLIGDLFKQRAIKKTYTAVVKGHPDKTGTIDLPIDRDPVHRNQMTHKSSEGRDALTHYKVLEYYNDSSLVEAYPVTGRTHQIRVHFAAIGHPLIGDFLYGKRTHLIKRHALHAASLSFAFGGQPFSFNQPLPSDMNELIARLKNERESI